MEIKKIAVCGDSYCVADNSPDRNHFSQILADNYGYEIIHLALEGCTNVCIAYQMQRAIQLKADAVIYNMTFPGRVDIVMDEETLFSPAGLNNFVYPYKDNAAYGSKAVGNEFGPVFSTPPALLEEKIGSVKKLTPAHVEAVKTYFLNFYHHSMRQEIDSWILAHWHQQIQEAGILAIPLINNSPLKVDFDPELGKAIYDFTKNNSSYPTVYHTDAESQRITAEKIHQHIQNKLTTTSYKETNYPLTQERAE